MYRLYTFRQKLKTLEEEVKNLRKKYRKLDDRITILEGNKNNVSVTNDDSKSVSIGKNVKMPTPPVKVEDKMPTPPADVEEELVAEKIAGVVGDQNILKSLCSTIFTEEELVTMTRTGKRTSKCMDNVKPQLDRVRFGKLEALVKRHTSYDKDTFVKKFENYQKVLRREKKKEN